MAQSKQYFNTGARKRDIEQSYMVPQVQSQRNLLSVPGVDSGISLPKEEIKNPQVRRHWDYIQKRGQHLRDQLGAMTPSVAGYTDRGRQVRLDSVRNMFQRNQSHQVLPAIIQGGGTSAMNRALGSQRNLHNMSTQQHLDAIGCQSTRNLLDGSTDLTTFQSPEAREKLSINDFLNPITELRQIKRLKFDPESPKFSEACERLQIDKNDITKKKLVDFEKALCNERPEEESNHTLIRELATIRFNYYLTTFKEIFNDVIEERRHIRNDGNKDFMVSSREQAMSRETAFRVKTDDLRKSTSQNVLESRFATRSLKSGGKRAKDFTTSIMSTASVASIPTKTVMLTMNDQKQIDKMRQRNEKFTNKLINDQSKKEKYQQQLIMRSQKHEKNQKNLEEKEYDRQEFVMIAKERREKQQELIKIKREQEEKKWQELHEQQKAEAEKRIARLQLIDADKVQQMKDKDALERQQRQVVVENKLHGEKMHEQAMKNMIGKLELKQKQSMNAYQRNLNRKVKMAKDSNCRMEEVARRAKEVEQAQVEQKFHMFQNQTKKFHEKLVIRQENIEWQQWETKMQNEKRTEHHLQTSKNIKQLDADKLLISIEQKQRMAEERVHKKEQDMDQCWKIYNEEEANKKKEREKKIQRNQRKLALKKEKVLEKQLKHEAQVRERKMQQEQAIALKRELNLRMSQERKQMQDVIKQIDKLENKNVDEALEKQGVDGAAASIKKKKKNLTTQSDMAYSDSGGYPRNDRLGW